MNNMIWVVKILRSLLTIYMTDPKNNRFQAHLKYENVVIFYRHTQ